MDRGESVSDTIITAAIEYIQDLFRGNSGGHDAEHSLRVYRSALRIAEGEKGSDTEIVALAALLHDADDHKLFQTENNAIPVAAIQAATMHFSGRCPLSGERCLRRSGGTRRRIQLICSTVWIPRWFARS
ncbi:MAG: HD domain-containing protein [Ruminococcaceae bacterium]|nr:HD domain-containing protein [Oscillospiraceae bacterium]